MPPDPQYHQTTPGQQNRPPQHPPQQAHPHHYGHYPTPPTNTMAILALVLAFAFWPLGIVFGHIARWQIARTGESGKGVATAGLVVGYIFLVLMLAVAVIVLVALAGAAAPAEPYGY